MEQTKNLGITYLTQNVANKEILVNEALFKIDSLLNNSVVSKSVTTPPENPDESELYIIPAGATDDWSGFENNLALYHPNKGWIIIPPNEGASFWIRDESKLYTHNGIDWIESIKKEINFETGSFTPILTGNTRTGVNSYSFNTGTYSLIGNRVFFELSVFLDGSIGALDSEGHIYIEGLPYSSKSKICGINISFYNNAILDSGVLGGRVDGDKIDMRVLENTATYSLKNYHITDNFDIRLSGIYDI